MEQIKEISVLQATASEPFVGTGWCCGWFPIAKRALGADEVHGTFSVTSTTNGENPGKYMITADLSYGNVFATCNLKGDVVVKGGVHHTRVIYNEAYKQSYAQLEVYVESGTQITVQIVEGEGWELVDKMVENKDDNAPFGYASKEIQLGELTHIDISRTNPVPAAEVAVALANPRRIRLEGAVTGSVSFDGTKDVVINTASGATMGAVQVAAKDITQDAQHLFFTKAERDKLAAIQDQATKCAHPVEITASMIKFADGETLQQKYDAGTLIKA